MSVASQRTSQKSGNFDFQKFKQLITLLFLKNFVRKFLHVFLFVEKGRSISCFYQPICQGIYKALIQTIREDR